MQMCPPPSVHIVSPGMGHHPGGVLMHTVHLQAQALPGVIGPPQVWGRPEGTPPPTQPPPRPLGTSGHGALPMHTVPCGARTSCRPHRPPPSPGHTDHPLSTPEHGPTNHVTPPKSTLHSAKSHMPLSLCPRHPQVPPAAAHLKQRKAPERAPGLLPTRDSGCRGTGAWMAGSPCPGRGGGSRGGG